MDLKYFSELLSEIFSGPSYTQTYRQRQLREETLHYQSRRWKLLGIKPETWEQVNERVGYVSKSAESEIERQWNRQSIFATLLK